MNGIVHFGTAAAGRLKSHADLHPLDRLHGHDGLRESAVELAIPLCMRSQTDRQAIHPHLNNAAERVALFAHAINEFCHQRIFLGVERIDAAGVTNCPQFL